MRVCMYEMFMYVGMYICAYVLNACMYVYWYVCMQINISIYKRMKNRPNFEDAPHGSGTLNEQAT